MKCGSHETLSLINANSNWFLQLIIHRGWWHEMRKSWKAQPHNCKFKLDLSYIEADGMKCGSHKMLSLINTNLNLFLHLIIHRGWSHRLLKSWNTQLMDSNSILLLQLIIHRGGGHEMQNHETLSHINVNSNLFLLIILHIGWCNKMLKLWNTQPYKHKWQGA